MKRSVTHKKEIFLTFVAVSKTLKEAISRIYLSLIAL